MGTSPLGRNSHSSRYLYNSLLLLSRRYCKPCFKCVHSIAAVAGEDWLLKPQRSVNQCLCICMGYDLHSGGSFPVSCID